MQNKLKLWEFKLISQLKSKKVSSILQKVVEWGKECPEIYALAVVGSWARGTALINSDIDLMLLCSDPSQFRNSREWLEHINWESIGSKVDYWRDADYGVVWSRHIFLQDRTEIEFSFGCPQWASLNPIDPGTFRVINHGCRIYYDAQGLMTELLEKIKTTGDR